MTRIEGGFPPTTTLSPGTFQMARAPRRLEMEAAIGQDPMKALENSGARPGDTVVLKGALPLTMSNPSLARFEKETLDRIQRFIRDKGLAAVILVDDLSGQRQTITASATTLDQIEKIEKKIPDMPAIVSRPVERPVMDVVNRGDGSGVWKGAQAFLSVPGEADLPGSVDRWLEQNPGVRTIVIDARRKNLFGHVHSLPERLGLPVLFLRPDPIPEEKREAEKDLAALETIARKRGVTIVLSDPQVTSNTHAHVVTPDGGLQRLRRPPGSSMTR